MRKPLRFKLRLKKQLQNIKMKRKLHEIKNGRKNQTYPKKHQRMLHLHAINVPSNANMQALLSAVH